MRKVSLSLQALGILTALLLFSGCLSTANNNNINKSKSEIRKIAYESLTEPEKTSIIDWENAEVEDYNAISDHSIAGPTKTLNIKGKDTYRVTFRTNSDGLLGPITVYLDRKSYKTLGYDFRY